MFLGRRTGSTPLTPLGPLRAGLDGGCPTWFTPILEVSNPSFGRRLVRLWSMERAEVSAMQGILEALCPRCRRGKIFRRSMWLLPGMYERCAFCNLKFEREDGYFLGAMYIGYGLAIGATAVLAALVWVALKWPLVKSVVAGIVLFLPLAPALTVMARVLWIYMDQAIDPDQT